MNIDELLRIMPVPEQAGSKPSPMNWAAVEARLGLPLPDDYKGFVERYGTGQIDEFLWVWSPFAENIHVNLIEASERQLAALRELGRDYPELYSFKLFPELAGLLPFARTDNGDLLCWRTGGSPDNWPVVVIENELFERIEYKVGMVEFLSGILARRIRCPIFPATFPRRSSFSTWKERP